VRVRHGEGVAIRIGPEPCACIREGVGEASAGERAGQPLSRVSDSFRGADALTIVEGNIDGHAMASVCLTPRGLRPWHVRKLFAREPGDLQLDHSQCQRGGPHREGEEP
jgi:hypothetical protein